MSLSFDQGAAGPAAHAAGRGPSSSLEYFQNVVTDQEGNQTFEVAKCGCDCWYCADCCVRKGYNLRGELIPLLESFTGLMMLTLTVDPELFASPQEAYLYCRTQRVLSKLMQDLDRAGHLHTRRYFYVVEFQKHTQQPHFHVLIDATFVPKPAIDAAWDKFRPREAGPIAPNRPAFGMTRFSVREFKGGAEHAGRYATKYLCKTPTQGWPAWVMAMGAVLRVPRYGTSRGFWGREPKPASEEGKMRAAVRRSYLDRVGECGTSSNIFVCGETLNPGTGEVTPSRSWQVRLEVDVLRLVDVPLSQRHGPRRVRLQAKGLPECIELIRGAVGECVRILGGAAARGATP